MSNLAKVKLSKYLSSSLFWIAIIVFYLESTGLSLTQVYQLISIYSIGIVVFEYPTGVIGDYYSHKLSVFLGLFGIGITFFLLSFQGSFNYYLILVLLTALAFSLFSGSDVALLNSVSSNFKKDFADTKSISLIFRMFAIAIGGVVGAIDLKIPLYLTTITSFSAGLILLNVKVKKNDKGDGNIFDKAVEGMKFVTKRKELIGLVLLSSLMAGFYISIKWAFNPLFKEMNLPLEWWGILIGVATLANALGTRIYKRIKKASLLLSLGVVAVSMVITGLTVIPALAAAGLIILFFTRGVIETQVMVKINNKLTDSIRASIFSLRSLIGRLLSSLYLLSIGYILDLWSVLTLMIFSSVVVLISGSFFIRIYRVNR